MQICYVRLTEKAKLYRFPIFSRLSDYNTAIIAKCVQNYLNRELKHCILISRCSVLVVRWQPIGYLLVRTYSESIRGVAIFAERFFRASQQEKIGKNYATAYACGAPIRPRHLVPTQQGVETLALA